MKLTEDSKLTRGAYEKGSFNRSIKEAVDNSVSDLDSLAKDVGHYLFKQYLQMLVNANLDEEDIEITISNPDLPQRLVSKVGKAIVRNVEAEGTDTWWDDAKSEIDIAPNADAVSANSYIDDDEFNNDAYSSSDDDLLGESLTKKNHPALQSVFKKLK